MTRRLLWRHHAACPPQDACAWWSGPPIVWRGVADHGADLVLLPCPACGSHVAPSSLTPVVVVERDSAPAPARVDRLATLLSVLEVIPCAT